MVTGRHAFREESMREDEGYSKHVSRDLSENAHVIRERLFPPAVSYTTFSLTFFL